MSELTRTAYEIAQYYVDTLIIQYHGKPKARATVEAMATAFIEAQSVTVQSITADRQPVNGSYGIEWNGGSYLGLSWADTASQIQIALRQIPGMEEVIVQGTLKDASSNWVVTVYFEGVPPVAAPMLVYNNSMNGADTEPITLTVAQVDLVLPLAIQDAFNLNTSLGPKEGVYKEAAGVQLDFIGKYVGVTRSGPGFTGQITLADPDFLQFIRIAIARNNLGSSLYDIDTFIDTYFPNQMLISDFANMHMSYLISTNIGSYELLQRLVRDKMLPKPMAVQIGLIIYAPVISDFFGFRTYDAAASFNSPFNSYANYHTDWPWLSYAYALIF